MRITIIPSEDKISINGELIEGCDLSWIPEFVGDITGVPQKVHAVQWYDDHGEIELVTRDNNIPITELGIFEQAIIKHQERKVAIEEEIYAQIAAAEAESLRIAQEEAEYLERLEEINLEEINVNIEELLAEL
jgi:hypothetical protein